MRILFLLAVLAFPASAEEVWVLQTGPASSDIIPLKPLQPVGGWRGLYTDGADGVWLYVTRSPNFFPPNLPEVRRMTGTPWTAAVFFPESWTAGRRGTWFDSWQKEFLNLSTFAQPGWPVVFPAVLKLPALTKG